MKIQDFTAEKLSTVSHAFRPSSCINAWNVHLPHPFTPGNLWSCETVSSVAYEVRDADRWERWDEMGEAVSECAIQICVCFLRRKYVSTTAVLARKTFSATSKECALRALDSDRSNRKFSQRQAFWSEIFFIFFHASWGMLDFTDLFDTCYVQCAVFLTIAAFIQAISLVSWLPVESKLMGHYSHISCIVHFLYNLLHICLISCVFCPVCFSVFPVQLICTVFSFYHLHTIILRIWAEALPHLSLNISVLLDMMLEAKDVSVVGY